MSAAIKYFVLSIPVFVQRKIIFSSTEPFAKETFLTMMNRLYLSSVQRNTILKGPNFFPSLAPLIFNYKSCILPPPPFTLGPGEAIHKLWVCLSSEGAKTFF